MEEATMAPSGLQPLNVIDVEDFIVKQSRKIYEMARRIYGNPANYDEIEDITHNILVLLIENDYHRLRSFDGRSKFETWLYIFIRNYVGQYQWKRRCKKNTINVDGLSLDALSHQPVQE